MTRRSYIKALNEILSPLGFERRGDDWIRVRGNIWECVNRQASVYGGVTVNLSAKDLETEKLFLCIFEEDGAIQMPPVDQRIGALMDGYDRWWKTEEVDGPSDMAETVLKYGLPWFDGTRTLEQQIEHWYGGRTVSDRGYHARSMIGLALTLYRMGEADEAGQVVRKQAPRTAIPSAVECVGKVREWLDRQSARNDAHNKP